MSTKSVVAALLIGIWPAMPASLVAQEAGLRVTVDSQDSEILLTLGPMSIPAGDHDMMQQPKVQAVALPLDAFLHGFRVDLVDGDGREVPSGLLHHVNLIAPHRRELFSEIMQRVGAAGAETGPFTLPRLLGYPVSKGDSLVVSAMFHNPTSQSYQDVVMRVHMKYSSAGSIVPTIAIQPFYLDVMPPAGVHAFTLPAGKSSKSWEGRPAVPGRILAVGGHMHKYGVVLRFEDVTKGKVLWEAKPIVDSLGNVIGMPRKFFFWRLGLPVDPNHIYRLTAEYDNPTGQAIEDGAMGTLGGVFVPDERATWPAVDPRHPEYLADVKITFARNNGDAMQHHHH